MEQQIHFCTTDDGVRIAYATVGQGPPLVKVANWLNHLEFDWHSPIWRHVSEEFARSHFLVRYDERGNGLSDWDVENISFEAFVRDLEAVVNAVGLERFVLLGISQGGPVAIAYAIRHPEKVSQLVLYGSYARGWAKRGSPADEIERRQAYLTLTKLGWGQDHPAYRQLWTSLFVPDGTLEQWRWFNDLQRVSASPENAFRLLNEVGTIDVVDLLPQLKVPTLVLHCRDDAVAPFEEGRLLASLIPGARFVPLEGRNHLILENEPAWPAFVSEVRRFLGTDASKHERASDRAHGSSPTKFSQNSVLGRYRILSKLGAGGMGEVYLAEDTKLHRRVALKILPAEFCQDGQRTARFLREAQAASALNHPNICTIHEINDDNDVPFIAMEYVEGETLYERIKDGELDLAEALDIALQIADALVEAHAHDIVHRDIKPANIIVNRRGQVKILDFGLAKRVVVSKGEAETQQLLSEAGMILGTAAYMSPEQARGLAVDARTDVWSFGVVLYEMLAGERPFLGETTTDLLAAILRSEPEGLWKFNHEVPADLERIVLKTLRKKRDERYKKAKDLYADLKQLRKDLDLAAARELSEPPPARAGEPTSKEKPATSAGSDPDARNAPSESWAPRSIVEARNSIAVLPFTNMSADPDNEYFCDGLAEELLNALAKIEDLRVAARTSAFSFKGKTANINDIGNALGVKSVLEGSVRKSGNRLRITVQLINAADGYHLWSERYDREMKDIFDVQDEITLAVVDALKVKLLGEEKAVVLKRHIANTEAYELYLMGRYHFNKHTIEDWLKGIECFEKAIEIEPEYAPAYAQIGVTYVALSFFGLFPPHQTLPKGTAVVTRALEIDDQLAEAHAALANILFYYDWDWAKAEREFKRAAELNPNDANTRWRLGLFLASRERFAKAVKEGERAVELDPLSLMANLYAGFIYLLADRFDDALRQVARMIEIEPNFHGAYWLKGTVLLAQEEPEEAIEALVKSMALGGTPIAKSYLGCAYGLAGKREEALGVLNELLETRERQYTAALNIARVYSGMGEIDSACEWLEKAVEERNGEIVFLNVGTKSGTRHFWRKTIRADQRYQDILRRVGLTNELAQGRSAEEASEAPTAISHPTSDVKMPE